MRQPLVVSRGWFLALRPGRAVAGVPVLRITGQEQPATGREVMDSAAGSRPVRWVLDGRWREVT
ncbi:hypothetical protein CPHO_09355 [Corynebacterium phocae]|uniref:Uncharacterized protein n=1 Tax=Corynebacterium phocae TaxID=161895 RepID=A0A1L7D4E8_9CORY|nr:hypothetical protein CPHO_09355 [Corynebacterium phocae]